MSDSLAIQMWWLLIPSTPNFQISEKLKPPAIITTILTKLSGFIPTWKIVPTKNIIDTAFKDPIKRQEVTSIPKRIVFFTLSYSMLLLNPSTNLRPKFRIFLAAISFHARYLVGCRSGRILSFTKTTHELKRPWKCWRQAHSSKSI